MKTKDIDLEDNMVKETNEIEKILEEILQWRYTLCLFSEQLLITKNLEQKLHEDQMRFSEYLSDIKNLYSIETDDKSQAHIGNQIPDVSWIESYGKEITLEKYFFEKNSQIFYFLLNLEKYWQKGDVAEVTIILKEDHKICLSLINQAKEKLNNNFLKLERLTIKAIEESSETQKNENVRILLEEMRVDLKKNVLIYE